MDKITNFINLLSDWKKNFSEERYNDAKYCCEVADIAKMIKQKDIQGLIDFWNDKTKYDFFELQHPIFNHIKTRAVFNANLGMANFVFFIDSTEKYFWIMCSCEDLVNFILTTDEDNQGRLLLISYLNHDVIKNVISLLYDNLKNCNKIIKYENIQFHFLLSQTRPWHFFYDQFIWFCAIEKNNKSIIDNSSFFIPTCKKLKTNKQNVALFPTVMGGNYMRNNLPEEQKKHYIEVLKNMRKNILNLSLQNCQAKKYEEYDLRVWLGLPAEKRSWIDQIENTINIIKNLNLYFKKIVIFFDGMTILETQENNTISKLYQQFIELIRKIKIECDVVNLAYKTYKHKVQYADQIDIFISDGGTTKIVPFDFCQKPGIILGQLAHLVYPSEGLLYKTIKNEYIINVQCGTNNRLDFLSYHLPWQHVYNLAADILEQLSLDGKLKIKNLRMHRLDVPPVELLSRQYTLEQELKMKEEQIQSLNQKISTLELEIAKLTNTLNSLPVTKQNLEIKNIEQDVILKEVQIQEIKQGLINKQLQTKKLEKEIENEKNALEELRVKNQELEKKNVIIISKTKQLNQMQDLYNTLSKAMKEREAVIGSKLSFCLNYGTAKSRIQNQLSYKLGQAMIVNSKSILGYIRMPFVLSYIKDKHKQEQKIYQEKIKKDPSLKLPPLESYPDYKEALKEKECFTYKLGEALIRANNNWYKGGYIKLWFEIRKLKENI